MVPRTREPTTRPRGLAAISRSLLFWKKTMAIAFIVLVCFVYYRPAIPEEPSKNVFQAFDKTQDQNILPDALVSTLDAVLVLGGGVPSSLEEPPVYVQRRCDVAAAIVQQRKRLSNDNDNDDDPLPILTLSAGTAHVPQLIGRDGLPIWESTSSAAYLTKKHGLDQEHVYAETTSYDTISNAFFSRTNFADIVGWRRLLIITNEFHMSRSKEIFDWIFGVDPPPPKEQPYRMFYLSCDDVGLTEEALAARAEHETRGAKNIKEKLAPQYTSLKGVWMFLNHKHDFYATKGLIKRAEEGNKEVDSKPSALKESYGGGQKK